MNASGLTLTRPAPNREGVAATPLLRSAAMLPVLVSAVCSLWFIARSGFTVNGERYFTLFDDAMISMRYARNLAAGHGLVWNPGEPAVEGYTNFLWTLWMALLHLLPVPESKTSLLVMISGALILLANVLLVDRIVRQLPGASPFVSAVAAWLTAMYYPLAYWTLRGTEVGLVTLVVLAAVLLTLRLRADYRARDLAALAGVLVVGLLTRTDALVPAAIVAGFVVLTVPSRVRRVALLALGGSLALTLALHTGFRVLYYGLPLPNTYYLKMEGIGLDDRLMRGGLLFLYAIGIHLGIALALASAGLLARRRWREPGFALLAAIVLGQCAYSLYVGGDVWEWMGYANRYLAPGLPLLFILAAFAARDLPELGRWWRRGLVAVLFALAVLQAALVAMHLLNVPGPSVDVRPRLAAAALVGFAAAMAGAFALLWWAGRRGVSDWRPDRTKSVPALAALALPGLLLVSLGGHPFAGWVMYGGYKLHADEANTRYALALRDVTDADATIALIWAGAIPYFSHRPTVDLLGKSDHVVATRAPRGPFTPGHDKWDYAYSIGELRPDLVAQSWQLSADDLADFERWGYVRLAPGVFVRADSVAVDRVALAAALARLPNVMHATRWPPEWAQASP